MYYDNSDLVLRPGMTADIVIVIAEKKDVVMIPNAALRVKLDGNDKSRANGPSVWVMEGNRPVRRPVKLGMGDAESTEVVEGLSEGETIIVESPDMKNNRRSGFRWMR
jgi:HlyD family secretion protein